MSASLEKLEAVYSDLLAIVKREVSNLSEQETLEEKQFRNLEVLDKILRAALEKYESKKPKSPFETLSTEDLAKDFE